MLFNSLVEVNISKRDFYPLSSELAETKLEVPFINLLQKLGIMDPDDFNIERCLKKE